jgi:hypothetical protein
MALKPIEYMEIISRKYQECKKEGLGRMSMEWSLFSSEMNRETRHRIERNDPDSLGLKYVFIYWVTISQLLDLHFTYKGKPFGKNKIKKKQREVMEIRNIIVNGVESDSLGLDVEPNVRWEDIMTRLIMKTKGNNNASAKN